MAYESKRWYCDPGVEEVMCNSCKHYRLFAKCDAFPNGIPSKSLDMGEYDMPCYEDRDIR